MVTEYPINDPPPKNSVVISTPTISSGAVADYTTSAIRSYSSATKARSIDDLHKEIENLKHQNQLLEVQKQVLETRAENHEEAVRNKDEEIDELLKVNNHLTRASKNILVAIAKMATEAPTGFDTQNRYRQMIKFIIDQLKDGPEPT